MNVILNLLLPLILTIHFASCTKKEISNPKTVDSKINVRYEEFTKDLEVPWSIVFTSQNRILLNERPGRVRLVENGILAAAPMLVVNEISNQSEEGLMGLALDPEYKSNQLIYLSYAYESKNGKFVKVVCSKDMGNKLTIEKTIFDGIPSASFHSGCRLKFGPDNMLYITTGDAGERKLAQDLNKLNGKILRINSDGTIPPDNPFPGSPVWTYGHRNPQGIDWFPGTDILWETEHGPSGFDGPGGGDEVNVIVKGNNYGWPVVSHENTHEGMVSPLLVFTPAEAPASGVFVKTDKIPGFKNNFLFGCLRGNGIIRVIIDENDHTKVKSFEKFASDFGRIREVTEGTDGYIYFSTSNRDGRGKVRDGDDKIYRITPN